MALIEIASEIRFHDHRCPLCNRGWRMVVWPGTRCEGNKYARCPICAGREGLTTCGQPGARSTLVAAASVKGRDAGATDDFTARMFHAPQPREIGGIRLVGN